MIKYYRVMVEGDDGTVFCVGNNIIYSEIDEVIEYTAQDYPEANIWVENESQVTQI